MGTSGVTHQEAGGPTGRRSVRSREQVDAIWQQFRGACDLIFFERFKSRPVAAREDGRSETTVAELRPWCLAPCAAAGPPGISTPRCRPRAPAATICRATLAPLADRVNTALFALVTRWPEGFKGTDLDPELTRGKMEKLIAKVEKLLPSEEAEPIKNLSPAELLARQWREALAANTMGAGAARQAQDARQRADEQEVRSAQSSWQRLGPLQPEQRKPLQDRFDRAVRKFLEMRRRSTARA